MYKIIDQEKFEELLDSLIGRDCPGCECNYEMTWENCEKCWLEYMGIRKEG